MVRSKSALPRGFKTEAENIALQHRALLGLAKNSPLDAFALASFLEIPVCPLTNLLSDADARKLTHPKDPKQTFSALWTINCDGDPIIIYNPLHSAYRQQSDVMHELAHIIRKHKTPDEVKILCGLFNLRSYNKLQEEEAICLGGCLQIPREALLWALKQNYTEEQMSEYFCASPEMVKFRLNSTGVKAQLSYRYAR